MDSSENYTAFEAYGVKVRIFCRRDRFIEEINERLSILLPNGFVKIPYHQAKYTFSIRSNKKADFVLYKGRKKITSGNDKEIFLKYFDSQVRLTVAEYAESKVFIHAGVVSWKGKAIILPAKSFQGKTTLVRELTKLGAKYYSDEYAVLDENGFVHPFPKSLSVRGLAGKYRQVEIPVESFGGVTGIEPVPVGLIVLTEFKKNAKWDIETLSEGFGVLEILKHTIPIRFNPEFSLKVLNNTVNRAIIVKTDRGEAKEFALNLLSFFESKAF